MSQCNHYLLVLEDNELVSTHLTRWFEKRFPQKQIVVARTVSEAQLLVSELPIDFFILDINLPDGNGIDFLCDLKMVKSNVHVIVMTATPLPEHRARATDLGSIRFMEKPVDLKQLEAELEQHLHPPASTKPAQTGVQAVLENLTVLDVVQLKCLNRCNAGLEVTRPDGSQGRIYFQDGEIIHAETSKLAGFDAFSTILSWCHGKISDMRPPKSTVTPTIERNWQMLLMEATQAIDEGKVSP